MVRHFRWLFDFSRAEIEETFERSKWLKAQLKAGKTHHPLAGKTLAMIFEKSSTRTRVSFEVGMYQLGGHALNITSQASQLGRGETYEDTAQVLSRYVDGIMVRTFEQERVERLAAASRVPVINGLTDSYHPCQIMTDIFTVIEHKGNIEKQVVTYVGDGNNIAHSWINAAIILGFELRVATPKGFEPAQQTLDLVKNKNAKNVHILYDAREAVAGADVINTDTWVSMGQEGAGEDEKKKLFLPYQVNANLMKLAKPEAIVLHCLPAHRNEEITDEVMDGPQSRIFDQAENRLHVQKAILEKLIA